jgi:hypothetical protein
MADGVSPSELGGQDCPSLKSPPELCGEFSATPSLENDPALKASRQLCEAFYTQAEVGLNVICRYKSDSALQALASQLAKSDEQGADLQAQRDLLNQTHNLTVHYYASALDARMAMDKSFSQIKPKLAQMAKFGSKLTKAEVSCDKTGKAGSAPGMLLVGLSKHALEQLGEAQKNLDSVANRFLLLCDGNAIAPQEQGRNIQNTSDRFDVPVNATNQGGQQNPVDGAVPPIVTVDAKKTLIGDGTGVAEGALMTKVIGANATVFAGAACKLLSAPKIDALAIANAGSGIIANALGVSTFWFIGIGVAGDFIEASIRADWARADAKIVMPYLNYVRSVPNLDSAQAAAGYADQKNAMDYCQRCNKRDLYYAYCPAKNDYNPNYFDATVRNGCPKLDWLAPNTALLLGKPVQPTGPGCPGWPAGAK